MNRRQFLERCGLAAAAGAYPSLVACARPSVWRGAADEIAADVAIIGGGLGGCAAALAALRAGLRVVMTEPTDWIGGQMTSQAVPPDEHRWIETAGCTAAYRRMRAAVRDHYRDFYPLTAEARAKPNLNPGNGGVSALCCLPRAALAALEGMLAAGRSGANLRLLLECEPVAAETKGDRIEAVAVRSKDGTRRVIRAPYFIDATEQGDLLPLAKAEYVTGFESRRETGEPHAPDEAQPENIQSFTWCFAMDYLAGEDHTIPRPEAYSFWRDYVPELAPPWTGRLLDWKTSHPHDLRPRTLQFHPLVAEPGEGTNLWRYRRILDRSNFEPGAFRSDVTLVNWPQNDYWLGRLHDAPRREIARSLAGAKQLSLSLLYWMQTEAPRPDGGIGWPGLRLRPDIVGTEDGLAKAPYIRESRRIRAEFAVVEQHVSLEERAKLSGGDTKSAKAERFYDSVGVGSYRVDLHPSTGGDNYIDFASLPFQIPLGSLIPVRMENLLPGCKNLGVTHLTNGCYRLHPVEWNIGEAAGALAAFCIAKGEPPRRVRSFAPLLGEFQSALAAQGVELEWKNL